MYKWVMAVLFFGGIIVGAGYMVFAPSDKAEEGGKEIVKKAELVAANDPAYKNVYTKSTCVACHGTDLKGLSAPTLLGVGDKFDAATIMRIIKEGYPFDAPVMQGQYEANIAMGLTDADLLAMSEWLAKQKVEGAAPADKK